MRDDLKPVFDWVVSSTGTTVFCLAIALFGLVAYASYLLPRTISVRRQLRKARATVETYPDGESFASGFEDLNSTFANHRLLGHAWREFVESFIWPPHEDGSKEIWNTHQANEYFDATSLAQSRMNLRVIQAIPGYLTGFGILGTFIGLVAGISLASEGLGSDEVAEVKRALTPLLAGAAVAFLTSVVGLFTSILFSMAEKYHLHGIETDVDKWNEALDKRLRHMTPEQLARRQIEEAVKQTLQLETFNTDLAMSVASALEERLQKSFGPQLGLVVTGLQDLKGQQASFSEELLNRVSDTLTQALSGAAGTEMKTMGETLGGLVGVLREAAGALATGQSEMAGAVKGIIGRIEEAFGQSATALSSETARVVERLVLQMDEASRSAASGMTRAGQDVSDTLSAAGERAARSLSDAALKAAQEFGQSAALVTSGANTFGDVARRIADLHAEHGTALLHVQAVLKDLQAVHGAFRLSVDPLNGAVQGLKVVNEALTLRVQESSELQRSLTAAAADVRAAQAQMTQAFADYEQRFKGVDESLGRTFVQLTEGVDTYTATVRQFVSETEKQFSKALAELSNVLNELDGTVEEFTSRARLQAAGR